MFILIMSCTLVFSQDKTQDVESKLQTQLLLFPQEKLHLHLDKSGYLPGETIWFRSYLLDAAYHQPVSNSRYIYVELISDKDAVFSRVMIRPDSLGVYQGHLKIPESIIPGEYSIRSYTDYMNNFRDYFFQNKIYILSYINQPLKDLSTKKDSDFDVQFFPEGGQIPAGVSHKIAFKAIGTDGLHRNIKGSVLNERQDTILSFSSGHYGMGSFNLKASLHEKYYVECVNESGEKRTFTLPEATNCFALKVQHSRGRVVISIGKPDVLNWSDDPLYILIHTRGIVQYYDYWKTEKEHLILDTGSFLSGVSQIVLFDGKGNPLSERLVFILNKDQLKVTLISDKTSYGVREPVNLGLRLDGLEEGDTGDLSVSITDDDHAIIDTTFTIASNLLLTSEIKGFVENSAYYLRHDDRQASGAADLLMLTQGWRRYDIKGVMKNQYQTPVIPYETSQHISGMVRAGYFKKLPAADSKVSMFVPEYGYFDLVNSDQQGSFSFSGFEYPDSTIAIIQAIAEKERADKTILEIDEPYCPLPDTFYRTSPRELEKSEDVFLIQRKLSEKYLKEEGMRMIELSSIDVVASKKKKEPPTFFNLMCERIISTEEIEALEPTETKDLIWALPFMNINREQKFKDFIYIVDDQQMYEDFDPNSIPVQYINSIGVLKGNRTVVLGRNYGRTAIVITTKKFEELIIKKTKHNLKKVFLKGYQQYMQFYHPRYDVTEVDKDETADLRTTIYWNPSVKVKSNEHVNLQFYTSDNPGSYSVKLEGITQEGKIIYGLFKMNYCPVPK